MDTFRRACQLIAIGFGLGPGSLSVADVVLAGGAAIQSGETIERSTSKNPSSYVDKLLVLLRDSCLKNGDNPHGLNALANERGWVAASQQELRQHQNQFTRLVGGWSWADGHSAYAMFQSTNDQQPPVYVCSITVGLPTIDAFVILRSEFEKYFATGHDQDVQRRETVTYRYWLRRVDGTPVRTSLVHTPASNALTVRLIFGMADSGN